MLGEDPGRHRPGCVRVVRLRRVRKSGGEVQADEVPAIDQRARRGIENRPHGVREGTSGEDASRILEGGSARVMAIRRDAIIPCPGRAGHRNAADATRHGACHPGKAVGLLSTPT